MAEIKENQETFQVATQLNPQAPTVSTGEPAQTAVERVKNPKKAAAGRAGAAARKAK